MTEDGALAAMRGSTEYEERQDAAQTILQLQTALESRIVIEQAKGVLSERFRLTVDEAFKLLRDSARNGRMSLRTLAELVVERSDCTPAEIAASLARRERWQEVVGSASPAA